MSKVYLSNKCPICGNKIYLNSHGYRCERCSFHIKNYICNRHLTIEEVEDILAGKQIILDGFSSNMGEVFSSIPVVKGNTIRLDNTVVQIPQVGRVVVGTKYFVFDKERHNTSFRLQRMYNGHFVTVDEVKTLLYQGKVVIDTYDGQGNKRNNELHLNYNKMRVLFQ